MFKKPVWEDFCFVTWCIIILEITIWRWVNCGHKGMHMVVSNKKTKKKPNHKQRHSNDWLALTGPKCAKKTFPTPLHHLHLVDKADSCSWHQILTQPSMGLSRIWDASDQAAFFQSSNCPVLVSPCPLQPQLSVLAFLRFLREVEPNMVFCCCRPWTSRFDVLGKIRHFSAHHNCTNYN